MGDPASGLRANYERSTVDLPALQALAREVAQHPARAATGLISDEALPQIPQIRTVTKDVQVRGLLGSRTETREVTETVGVPDETRQTFGWWFGILRWSDREMMRDKPGAYCADIGRAYYALLADGALAAITETWREGVLIGGPVYQRWNNNVNVRPLTADDVVRLDHDVRHHSGKKGYGITFENEQFGPRIRDGVRRKGDYVRSCLLDLSAATHRARLAATHTSRGPRPTGLPGPRLTGRVKWVDTGKSFGFITPSASEPDLFFHMSQVEHPSMPLAPGAAVTYEVRDGKRGPAAVRVTRA